MTIEKPNAWILPDKTNLGLRSNLRTWLIRTSGKYSFRFSRLWICVFFVIMDPAVHFISFLKKLTVIQSNSFVWILSKREIIKMIIKTCIFFYKYVTSVKLQQQEQLSFRVSTFCIEITKSVGWLERASESLSPLVCLNIGSITRRWTALIYHLSFNCVKKPVWKVLFVI